MSLKYPWTAERDAVLVRMRSIEHKPWGAIVLVVGLSRTACHRRYTIIVPKEDQVKLASRRKWTEEESNRLYRLRHEEKKSLKELVEIFGMTHGQVTSKLDRMSRPMKRIQFEQLNSRFNVPQSCLDDRARRQNAPRDLTAAFCGDPEPCRVRW